MIKRHVYPYLLIKFSSPKKKRHVYFLNSNLKFKALSTKKANVLTLSTNQTRCKSTSKHFNQSDIVFKRRKQLHIHDEHYFFYVCNGFKSACFN